MSTTLFLYLSLPAFALGFIFGWFCRSLNRAQKRAGYPPIKPAIDGVSSSLLQAAQDRLNRAVKATIELPRWSDEDTIRETAAFRRAPDERLSALEAHPLIAACRPLTREDIETELKALNPQQFSHKDRIRTLNKRLEEITADERAVKAKDNSPKHTS